MSQCLGVMMRKRHAEKDRCPMDDEFSVEVMAEHIVRFSLAGIEDMRRRINSGQSSRDTE